MYQNPVIKSWTVKPFIHRCSWALNTNTLDQSKLISVEVRWRECQTWNPEENQGLRLAFCSPSEFTSSWHSHFCCFWTDGVFYWEEAERNPHCQLIQWAAGVWTDRPAVEWCWPELVVVVSSPHETGIGCIWRRLSGKSCWRACKPAG